MKLKCKCGAKFMVKDSLAGKKVKCLKCQEIIRIPPVPDAPVESKPNENEKTKTIDFTPDATSKDDGTEEGFCLCDVSDSKGEKTKPLFLPDYTPEKKSPEAAPSKSVEASIAESVEIRRIGREFDKKSQQVGLYAQGWGTVLGVILIVTVLFPIFRYPDFSSPLQDGTSDSKQGFSNIREDVSVVSSAAKKGAFYSQRAPKIAWKTYWYFNIFSYTRNSWLILLIFTFPLIGVFVFFCNYFKGYKRGLFISGLGMIPFLILSLDNGCRELAFSVPWIDYNKIGVIFLVTFGGLVIFIGSNLSLFFQDIFIPRLIQRMGGVAVLLFYIIPLGENASLISELFDIIKNIGTKKDIDKVGSFFLLLIGITPLIIAIISEIQLVNIRDILHKVISWLCLITLLFPIISLIINIIDSQDFSTNIIFLCWLIRLYTTLFFIGVGSIDLFNHYLLFCPYLRTQVSTTVKEVKDVSSSTNENH